MGKTTCIMHKKYMHHVGKIHVSLRGKTTCIKWGKATFIMRKNYMLNLSSCLIEHKLNKLDNNFEMSIFKPLNLEIRKH